MDYFVYIMCLNVRKAYSDLSGKPKIVQFDKYKQKHLDTAFNVLYQPNMQQIQKFTV